MQFSFKPSVLKRGEIHIHCKLDKQRPQPCAVLESFLLVSQKVQQERCKQWDQSWLEAAEFLSPAHGASTWLWEMEIKYLFYVQSGCEGQIRWHVWKHFINYRRHVRSLRAVSDPSSHVMFPFLWFIFKECVQKHTSQRARSGSRIQTCSLSHHLGKWDLILQFCWVGARRGLLGAVVCLLCGACRGRCECVRRGCGFRASLQGPPADCGIQGWQERVELDEVREERRLGVCVCKCKWCWCGVCV